MSTSIHPTAVIAPKAQLGVDVKVGPYSVVGEDVRVGDRTEIGAQVVIDGATHTDEWTKPMEVASSVYGMGHGDLNNDTFEDVVIPGNSTDRNVHALSGVDGSTLWTFPTGGEINCLIVEDMDNDGQLDVVAGSDDQKVYIIN